MVLFVSKWHHASEGTFYEQNLSKLLNLVFIRDWPPNQPLTKFISVMFAKGGQVIACV